MSNNKKGPAFLQDSQKVSLVATFITIILIIIFFWGGYSYGFSKGKVFSTKTSLNQNTNEELTLPKIPLPPEPPVVMSYSGQVTSIEGKIIQFTASVVKNDELVDKNIKVTVTDNTKLTKIDISQPPPLPDSNVNQADREEEIKFSDIKVGDKIIAQAADNVKDKSEYEATKVSVLAEGF